MAASAEPNNAAGNEGTKYYLSPEGNDASDGKSTASAWRTIEKANSAALNPGDSILFEAKKTFTGSLLVTASGSEKNPIHIGSYGDGSATLNSGNSFGIRLKNCQFVTLSAIILKGSGVSPAGTTTNTEAGVDILSTATAGPQWKSIHVEGVDVSGFRDGIVAHTPIGKQAVVGFADIRIVNCAVHECLFGGIYCWGSATNSGKPWNFPTGNSTFTKFHLADCEIYNIYGDPVGDPAICLPIQIFNANASLVERCTVHDCGQTGNKNGSQGGVGGFVFLECTNSIAQHCEIYHTVTNIKFDGCAFDIDGGCTDCILQYNYSHDNEGSGYQTGTFQGSSPTHNNTIRYNISQNDARKNSGGAIMFWAGSKAAFYNNSVFVGPSPSGTPAAVLMLGGANEMTFRNNIFVTTGGLPLINNPVGSPVTFQGNCYWSSGSPFLIDWHGQKFNSIDAWRKATQQELLAGKPTGVIADPLFKAPGAGTAVNSARKLDKLDAYSLLPGSPASGAGMNLKDIFATDPGATDFTGAPLAAEKKSMGAVEPQR